MPGASPGHRLWEAHLREGRPRLPLRPLALALQALLGLAQPPSLAETAGVLGWLRPARVG